MGRVAGQEILAIHRAANSVMGSVGQARNRGVGLAARGRSPAHILVVMPRAFFFATYQFRFAADEFLRTDSGRVWADRVHCGSGNGSVFGARGAECRGAVRTEEKGL